MPILTPSSGPGWVYVLTNPALPGVCKIGRTRRGAALRASEVSRSYGTALPFEVASKHFVADAAAVEWMAHRKLGRCRLPASELFRCAPRTAADTVKRAALAYHPPSRWWRWLRVLLTRAPDRHPARYTQGTNWVPALLVLSLAAIIVVTAQPSPAAWWPVSVARTVLLLERLR